MPSNKNYARIDTVKICGVFFIAKNFSTFQTFLPSGTSIVQKTKTRFSKLTGKHDQQEVPLYAGHL